MYVDKNQSRRKKIKIDGATTPVSPKPNEEIDENSLHMLSAIHEAIKGRLTDEVVREKKEAHARELDAEAIRTYMTEYLKCFVITGYDMTGNRILITNFHNAQEYDSMMETMRNATNFLAHMG